MVAALCFCLQQVQTEYRVSQALEALQSNDPVIDRLREDDLPAREALYSGMALARQAANLPAGPGRDAVLGDAARLIDQARDQRPYWGPALVALSYLNLLRFGEGDDRTIAAWRSSYRVAPFLRDEADWRIQYALAVWPRIGPDDRRAVAREAILLARGSRALAAHVRVMVSGTALQPLVSGRVW